MLDLNCDLGEGERDTAALMDCVTSANIACGGHAGDFESMKLAVRLAIERGVRIGAHPGLADRAGFGRNVTTVSLDDFTRLMLEQTGRLEAILNAKSSARLHHIKLHGALYHLVEESAALRESYLALVAKFWPELIVYARAGGRVTAEADRFGVKVWPEGFLDRAYRADGTLVPRSTPGAMLTREQFQERLRRVRTGAAFPSADGGAVALNAVTWCLHGDSPHALDLARRARILIEPRPGTRST
jgi:5-oxoprolinase (ATP-hydrolysing) subunit A